MDVLTDEDVAFLRELGSELKTQDNHGTAKPLFFMIREERKVVGVDFDYADGEVLAIGDEYESFYEVDPAKEFICEWLEVESEELSGCNSLEDLHDFLDIREYPNVFTGYVDGEKFYNCFLTKRACERHIQQNGYHYKHPKPFADMAWRNPEFERLLQIVEKFATVEDEV